MASPPGEHMQQQLLSLAEAVKHDYGRMDLSSMWRPYARLVVVCLRIATATNSISVTCPTCLAE